MISKGTIFINQYNRDLLLILSLFFLSFLFFGDVLRSLDGSVIFGIDLYTLFQPLRKYAFERFRAGELPFWNPYLFLGFPQYAEPQLSTFYLAMWLMALLPLGTGYALLYATHFGLTASGGYVLVRQLGGRWSGAFLTGLVLTFNLFMVAHLHAGHLPHLMTIAYLPWLLASAIWAVKVGTWMATVVAGVPLGLAMLVGYAPFFPFLVVAVSFVMIWLAFLTWQRTGARSGFRVLSQLVGIGLVAGLLASIQLIPTLELAQYSSRVAGADYEFASQLSMPIWNLLTLLMPDLYGAPIGGVDYWELTPIFAYWESAVYSGILPFILFVLAWVLGEKNWRFWVLIGLGGLLIALGPSGAFHHLFYQLIPGFGLFRVPAWMGYFYVLASAVLVGYMFDRWYDMPKDEFAIWQNRTKKALALIVPLLLILIMLTVIWQASLIEKERIVRMAGVTGQLVRLLLLSGASLALLIWGFNRQRWILLSLAALIILVDLWGTGNKFVVADNPDPDISWIMADEALPANRKEYRILTKNIEENLGIQYGFQKVGGYDDFRTESSRRMH